MLDINAIRTTTSSVSAISITSADAGTVDIVAASVSAVGVNAIHKAAAGVSTVGAGTIDITAADVGAISPATAGRTGGRHSSKDLTYERKNSPLFLFSDVSQHFTDSPYVFVSVLLEYVAPLPGQTDQNNPSVFLSPGAL
jgi:hypothetical protein